MEKEAEEGALEQKGRKQESKRARGANRCLERVEGDNYLPGASSTTTFLAPSATVTPARREKEARVRGC